MECDDAFFVWHLQKKGAKMTQGEVVSFAAAAADAMRADGMNVLMEGRAQTLNYVRTPHRFELTLSDPMIIGYRRAAQRMMALATEKLKGTTVAGESAVKAMLKEAPLPPPPPPPPLLAFKGVGRLRTG